MKKILPAFLCLLLLAPGLSGAAKVVEREMACPLCGHDFYALLDVPDPDYEMRLDLKPLGALPGPWRLPECPKCGLVIYSAGLGKRDFAKTRAAASSPIYAASAGRASYYRLGVLYGLLGKPDFLLANTFLKASWQEEEKPALLREDLELSLKHFASCAASCGGVEKENSQLLMGELLRRLGRFEEARAHLAALGSEKGFQNNFFADVVSFQLKLCASRDSGVHDMLEVKVARQPFFTRLRWHTKMFFLKLRSGDKAPAGR